MADTSKRALDESLEHFERSLNKLLGQYDRLEEENAALRDAVKRIKDLCDEGIANGAYYLAVEAAGQVAGDAMASLGTGKVAV